MNENWYQKGQGGYPPPESDKDPFGWKQLDFDAGRAQRKMDREISYRLTHPDDPYGDKDPFKT